MCNQGGDVTDVRRKFLVSIGLNSAVGKLSIVLYDNDNGAVGSESVTNLRFDDDIWRHCFIRCNAGVSEADIFINGAEVVYSIHNGNIGGGGPWAGFGSGTNTTGLFFGSTSEFPSSRYPGHWDRPKWWLGSTATDTDILNEYNNELAAMRSGFIGGERNSGRFDILEQHIWSRGVSRFKRS